jgi:glucuronosyltransferase
MWNIESNADLLLINSYEVLNNIRPSVPTTIYLGGIHQSLEKYPMSPSLSQFLVESDSAVYVNLNNPIQESSRIAKLLKSLENLQINIIWNSNSYFDVNTTARIYESSRFEQESILGEKSLKNVEIDSLIHFWIFSAHPKVNLHITDGGQRNIEDSIHYAVPVLGISYSSSLDQYLHKIEKFDCGIISYIDYENQQEFESKINNIQISPK